ncbi:3-oxoacyl-[acyl-carrier-protein] synthase I, chloroplastic [Glycine soja]|nr:3-oxoacyl-[acyl-carrier-protein] synthase I, chloroplastic [Glycine soja]
MSGFRDTHGFPRPILAVNLALALLHAAVAFLAFFQLLRIHMRNAQLGWTRQKVFHVLIGSSNLGYVIYLALTIVASWKGWTCWSHSCGFIFMAFPKVLFFAAFLLLLSFWVDLCHQAYDDDDYEGSFCDNPLLEKTSNESNLASIDSHRKCFPFRFARVGNRKKIVILVWGTNVSYVSFENDFENHGLVTKIIMQVYLYLSAIGMLLLGGALACYRILLCLKMSKVRAEKPSSEMWKVAGLTIVSVICFTSSSCVELLTDIPMQYNWHQRRLNDVYSSLLLILYYFVGSSIPSAVVLWVMRELPPEEAASIPEESSTIAFVADSSIAIHHPQRWATATSMQNQTLQIDKERAGVLVGSGMGGLTVFSDGVQALIEKGHRKITPFFIPYAITNMGSALLGIDLGFMGPNYSISTACATSNYCFYAAANHIRRGEADLMIAGGTEAAIIPIGLGGFVACRALSQRNDDPKTASRPWDKDRDGFVMGEGAGVLVMESLEHAMKRGAPIIAEYLGGAVNCDAYHMTDPRSDGLGVSTCIQSSLEDAGVSPEEVNYINAHATSTLAGDLAEINAIKKVFKDTSGIKINATKSMIGHCLGAAGGLEAIATVKAITTGWLHPTINQFNPEPAVDFDTVANVKQQHEINVAISNSFGFGGHNSVVAFSAFRP